MKQAFLLSLILLSALDVDGQKIRFTDTSNIWYQSVHNWTYSTMGPIFYKGDSTIHSTTYQKLYNGGHFGNLHLLIREDSAAKKVYYWDDTTERILYDFSLSIGDTITYPDGSHHVKSIDSVKIDSVWYKTFYFEPVNSQVSWPYTVIENVGCVKSLAFPIFVYRFSEGSVYLNCFYNSGTKPTLSKAVPNASPGGWSFDNKDSCYTYIIYVSVDDVPNPVQSITISPHPANVSSVITLPYTLQSGELTIYNTLGQIIRQSLFSNTSKLPIGQLPNSGMYYYRVSDKTNGQVWQGKMVYE